MNWYLLIILLFSLLGIKIFFKGFNKDYLSKDDSDNIKGIFILLIFFSHFMGYIKTPIDNNSIIWMCRVLLGQLVVTMFLFYSGYGIYESINKKKNYINEMPKNRILKTLLNFDIVVLLFLLVNFIFGKTYSFSHILLSLIGWNSVGNSNWYIFDIIVLYIISFIGYKVFKKDNIKSIGFIFVLTALFIILLSYFKGSYWLNTLLCYPLGMLYAHNKEKINKFLFNNIRYIISLIILFLLFVLLRKNWNVNIWIYLSCSMIFSLIVVLLTMKIKLNSKILKWFGSNLFWVYILQRIPMIIFSRLGYTIYPVIMFIGSFIITILLTFMAKYFFDKMYEVLKI